MIWVVAVGAGILIALVGVSLAIKNSASTIVIKADEKALADSIAKSDKAKREAAAAISTTEAANNAELLDRLNRL